jgi:poly(3-hydroxybutyrate) depolymerase
MKLIFVWHGLGGTIDDIDSAFWGYYGMAQVSDGSAILAAGQGLPTADEPEAYGWRNTDGEDIAFTAAMIEWFNSNFCIDAARIFATGMSFGGVMSNQVGCSLGDVVRAIGPIAGAGPGFGGMGNPGCVGQVAALLVHGSTDTTVTIDMGEASRDHWLEANGCSASTTPVEPTEYCLEYADCAAGYPVVWCEHEGGHTIPDFAAQAVWDFFQRF